MWQRTAGPGAPLRDREAELVPAAARAVQDHMLSMASVGRDLDPMWVAQIAVHAVLQVVEPYDYKERDHTCPQGKCKGGLMCPHPSDAMLAFLKRVEWEMAEEEAIRAANPGNSVKFYGLLWQEDGSMHVGGSRTWYSALHGRRDH